MATTPPIVEHQRHQHFYFLDGSITFIVENVLFRIHRYFFERDSSKFRELLAGDVNEETIKMHLSQNTVIDFERFLYILYPSRFDQHDLTTVEEWASVLTVASHWGFESIRSLSINQLFKIASPVDKIVLGRQHKVHQWLEDAYTDLCKRPEWLTREEGRSLGVEEVVGIVDVREQFMASPAMGADALSVLVRMTFNLDFPEVILPEEAIIDSGDSDGEPESGTSIANASRVPSPSPGEVPTGGLDMGEKESEKTALSLERLRSTPPLDIPEKKEEAKSPPGLESSCYAPGSPTSKSLGGSPSPSPSPSAQSSHVPKPTQTLGQDVRHFTFGGTNKVSFGTSTPESPVKSGSGLFGGGAGNLFGQPSTTLGAAQSLFGTPTPAQPPAPSLFGGFGPFGDPGLGTGSTGSGSNNSGGSFGPKFWEILKDAQLSDEPDEPPGPISGYPRATGSSASIPAANGGKNKKKKKKK